MQTQAACILQQQPEILSRCNLVVDGNAHRVDLLLADLPQRPGAMFCEAMLPQVRTVALMIAAERLVEGKNTPSIITDEADWFAARILVLQARVFHLDISLMFMLETANRRAQAFARKHGLDFTPARIQMSLHSGRPANLLMMKTALELDEQQDEGLIANSRRLAALLDAPF